MGNMRFKVGDRVKVKSLQWFNENHDDDYNVVFADGWHFSKPMSNFCGKELIIENIFYATNPPHYIMKDNMFRWTDEMIEGLVEEETLIERVDDKGLPFNEWLSHKGAFYIPEDYVLKDENGNVINATKIVLEKKKKEYPKTYEECLSVLQIKGYDIIAYVPSWTAYEKTLYQQVLKLRELIICRDAYWKIAGEEMELGKPWEPNEADYVTGRYCIFVHRGNIICSTPAEDCPLTFPTEEMRDAFKENFDPDIEFCKELL